MKFLESKTFTKNPFKRFVGIEFEHVGPEVEYFDDYDSDCGCDDCSSYRENSQNISPYNSDLLNLGVMSTDSSVEPLADEDGDGNEFKSFPANGDLLLKNIHLITRYLKDAGGVVNRTCGLHVHIDMRDIKKVKRARIIKAWMALESVFTGMVSDSRVDGEYTRYLAKYAKEKGDRAHIFNERGGRSSLNASAIRKHGTFEFRLHQGSLNAIKIKNWCLLLLSFVETFKDVSFTVKDLERIVDMSDREKLLFLFQTVKMPMSLKKYMVLRIKQFERVNLRKVA